MNYIRLFQILYWVFEVFGRIFWAVKEIIALFDEEHSEKK